MPWHVLGRSVHGRKIAAAQIGDPHGALRVAVVGCIDGDEPGGIRVVEALLRSPLPPGLDLWLIPDMNPDGRAANTRVNARGVDLNRNFPWKWQRLGKHGDSDWSGPAPLSEPESRAVHALLDALEPRLVVWYHQPLKLVDDSGGDAALEAKYAKLVGLPFRRLPRYPGSATSWVNNAVPGATSFVVELHPGILSRGAAFRHAGAVLELARQLMAGP